MGFWAAVTGVLKYAEPVINIAQGVQSILTARETSKLAEQQLQQQKAELLRQRQLSEIAARRTTRIQKARLLASQAASGAILSTVGTGVIGLETSLEAGLVDLAARTQFNIESATIQAESAVAATTGPMIGGMITAAAGTLEFTDLLRKNLKPEET